MSHWKVKLTEEAELRFKLEFKQGLISVEDIKILKRWIDQVESEGLEVAQKNITWRDHELNGKWKDYRSISFSYSGRVIYRNVKNKVIVEVVRVTTKHDYK